MMTARLAGMDRPLAHLLHQCRPDAALDFLRHVRGQALDPARSRQSYKYLLADDRRAGRHQQDAVGELDRLLDRVSHEQDSLADQKRRLGPLPNYVEGGARNPMGSRGLYLYAGGKDTLYRIHGTNQPEYIGHAISSGCIRLTNEDIIDLYSRVKMGAPVIVLGPKQGASRLASAGSSHSN